MHDLRSKRSQRYMGLALILILTSLYTLAISAMLTAKAQPIALTITIPCMVMVIVAFWIVRKYSK